MVDNDPNVEDILNKRFGKLVVIRYCGLNKRHERMFLCRCDCGIEKEIKYSNLIRSKSRSCGCSHKRGANNSKWGGHGKISGSFWSSIKKTAKRRNIPFELTIEEAWDVFIQQGGACALTGLSLIFNETCRKYSGNASLDRIDSSKGYKKDNIQWVHKIINNMKGSLSSDEFIDFCLLIIKNLHHKIENV